MISRKTTYQYWDKAKLFYKRRNNTYLFTEKDNKIDWLDFYQNLLGFLVSIFFSFYLVNVFTEFVLEKDFVLFSTSAIVGLVMGCFLLYLAISFNYIFWCRIRYFYSYLIVSEGYIYTFNPIAPPYFQRFHRSDIANISIRVKDFYSKWKSIPISEYKPEDKPSLFFLELELTNGKRKYLKFITSNHISQETLKTYISGNKIIELFTPINNNYHIESTNYQIVWKTKFTSIYWSMILYIVILLFLPSILLLATFDKSSVFTWLGVIFVLGFAVFFIVRMSVTLWEYWKVTEITIDKFGIKEYKLGTPFVKDYQILKQDIVLLSPTTIDVNKHAIQIISQSGDIHQLPIYFESEEKAKEQVEAMKQLLKLG